MKKEFKEGSELDGYDDLKPEDQAKVIKAWQAGRIPDEDIFESARKPADEDDEEKHKKTLAKRKATASGGDAEERPTTSKRMTAAVEVRCLLSNDCTLLLIMCIFYRRLMMTRRMSLFFPTTFAVTFSPGLLCVMRPHLSLHLFNLLFLQYVCYPEHITKVQKWTEQVFVICMRFPSLRWSFSMSRTMLFRGLMPDLTGIGFRHGKIIDLKEAIPVSHV